jgi:hypothetical protein
MLSSAFLAERLRSSLSFVPSLCTPMPVVAKKRRGAASSGRVK